MVDFYPHGVIFTGFPADRPTAMPPIGAYRLRTHLSKFGFDIQVIDHFVHWTDDEIMELVELCGGNRLMFIGFSVTFMVLDRPHLLDLIRQRWPTIKIVVGAQEPRLEHYVRSGCFAGKIDLLVMGFAELTLQRYLQHLQTGTDAFAISGEHQGQPYVISEHVHPYSNTDDLAVTWLPDDPVRHVKALPLEISRGCIFSCKFCNHSLTGKTSMDHVRSEDSLADEIKRNWETWGIRHYLLADDTFNDSGWKLDMVQRAIARSGIGIGFSTYLRYDLLHRYPDHVQQLKDMGLLAASLGIESMNPTARKAIGKGLDNAQLLEVLTALRTAGIHVHSGFIAGLPHDGMDDLLQANDWLMRHGKAYLDTWWWAPLWIGNHLHMRSPFERDASRWGYVTDASDEMLWTSPWMDSTTAEKLADRFNGDSDDIRGPVGFETIELVAMGVDPQALRGLTERQAHDAFDRMEMCDNLVRQYKMHKMDCLRLRLTAGDI